MDHIDAGHELEQLTGDVRYGSIAGRRHAELAGICLGVSDELRNRIDGKRRTDAQDDRLLADHRDRRAVANEAHLFVLRFDDLGRRRHQKRVAIGRRPQRKFGAYAASAPDSVFDHNGLAKATGKRGLAAFDELKQGIRDIDFLADPTKGEVRVGCPDSFAGGILAPFVEKFCGRYPGIAITIEPVPWPTLELPELHARKLDVVMSRLSKPQADDPFGDDVDVEILFQDEVVIVAAAKSPWARRRKISLADLRDASWVGT